MRNMAHCLPKEETMRTMLGASSQGSLLLLLPVPLPRQTITYHDSFDIGSGTHPQTHTFVSPHMCVHSSTVFECTGSSVICAQLSTNEELTPVYICTIQRSRPLFWTRCSTYNDQKGGGYLQSPGKAHFTLKSHAMTS